MSYRERETSVSHLDFSTLPGQIDAKNDVLSARSDVISKQPMSNRRRAINKQSQKWAQVPEILSGNFNPLEFLIDVDTLLIQQDLPSTTGENRYYIKNGDGETIFRSKETYYENMRIDYGFGLGPGFVLQILDENNNEIMRFNRPIRKAACCWCACKSCEGCSHIVIVESAGDIVGYIGQRTSGWKPYLSVADSKKKTRYRLRGPCCFSEAINDFEIFTADYGTFVGKVSSKTRPSNVKADETQVVDFELTFPATLDIKSKMLLLAGLYLIDSIFFEVKVAGI